jgi:hypothetical protein
VITGKFRAHVKEFDTFILPTEETPAKNIRIFPFQPADRPMLLSQRRTEVLSN